jgi:hypothetical protein
MKVGELISGMLRDDMELESANPKKVIGKMSPISRFRLLLETDLEIRHFVMDLRRNTTIYFEDLQGKASNLFESIL